MPVEITINWTFIGDDDEDARITYHLAAGSYLDEDSDADDSHVPSESRVLPLGSSVIAPGLSMPVGAP
jgi:hypothetical protein